jgi:SAM-dependent methyltransferase
MPIAVDAAGGMAMPCATERVIARAYGLFYDAVVRGFAPYEALLDEVAALLPRAGSGPLQVLDVSCGVGTVATRLARDGHAVVGIDAVRHLVTVARDKGGDVPGRVRFDHVDIARGPVPGTGTYDVVVSMHTLYWHPEPEAVLDACRGALKAGGHAAFLTYARPASVVRTFREVWVADGLAAALRALRWLVPTALFETFRDCDHRYLSETQFCEMLRRAGFEVVEARRTFLAGLSLLAWTRAGQADSRSHAAKTACSAPGIPSHLWA